MSSAAMASKSEEIDTVQVLHCLCCRHVHSGHSAHRLPHTDLSASICRLTGCSWWSTAILGDCILEPVLVCRRYCLYHSELVCRCSTGMSIPEQAIFSVSFTKTQMTAIPLYNRLDRQCLPYVPYPPRSDVYGFPRYVRLLIPLLSTS